MSHSLFSVKEVTHSSRIANHQHGLVAVTGKGKQRATTPFLLEFPQHGIPVLFIK